MRRRTQFEPIRKHIVCLTVSLLVLVVGLKFGTKFIPEEPIGSFYTDFTDCDFEYIAKERASRYNLEQVSSDDAESADLYVTVNKDVSNRFNEDDSIKIGKISPVLFVSDTIYDEIEGGTSSDKITSETNKGDQKIYTINMKSMLEDFAKTSKEIGLRADRVFGIEDQHYYKLIIPEENSEYREMVVNTIIASLLDGKSATKENLEAIKPTVDAIIANSYVSNDMKNAIANGSDDFIAIGPENWIGEINPFSYADTLYIKNCTSLWLECYYKSGKESIATTLLQSFKDDIAWGIFGGQSLYSRANIREANSAMSDHNSLDGVWEFCKDFVQETNMDEELIAEVFGD